MQKSMIEQQLDELFELQQQLHRLLNKEQYQEFQEQQEVLAKEIRVLIENNSAECLNRVVEKLRQLEEELALLKCRAEVSFKLLKDKSLLQRRNKNRLKAYK
jgi:predicted RND superfamily exporter protein